MQQFSKTLLSTGAAAMLSTGAFSAQAVTDVEFNQLKSQFDQLVETLEYSEMNQSNSQTSIGGYGELHYNNLNNGTGSQKKTIDFHRFVLFFGHEFSDDVRFFSELELEHAFAKDTVDGSGKGEVELEQAYVQIDLTGSTSLNAGVFLIPVGILNETHEPPTFYGTERNPVEKNIIPATWWEGGVMLSSHTASGLQYDIAVTSGLAGGADIRGGRQKTADATANNWALTGRVRYTSIEGLELAATLQLQDDMTQNSADNIDGGTLIEAHAVWNSGPVGVKALVAQWNIDGAGASATGKDKQDGAYVEASYKVNSRTGVFVRHSIWDNGGAGDNQKAQTNIGLNYWPHENVVFKVDYQAQDEKAGDNDGINAGVGYQF